MSVLSGLQPIETGGGRYFKFDHPGARVTGVIRQVELAWNYDQTAQVPELTLDTAEGEKIVTCSNTVLYNKTLELQDQLLPGVTVTITHTGMAGRAKLFDVVVGGAPVAPEVPPVVTPPTAQATPAPAVPPAAVAPVAGGTPPPSIV